MPKTSGSRPGRRPSAFCWHCGLLTKDEACIGTPFHVTDQNQIQFRTDILQQRNDVALTLLLVNGKANWFFVGSYWWKRAGDKISRHIVIAMFFSV